eukprot:1008798-Prymnesium_polylepis.1
MSGPLGEPGIVAMLGVRFTAAAMCASRLGLGGVFGVDGGVGPASCAPALGSASAVSSVFSASPHE